MWLLAHVEFIAVSSYRRPIGTSPAMRTVLHLQPTDRDIEVIQKNHNWQMKRKKRDNENENKKINNRNGQEELKEKNTNTIRKENNNKKNKN